MPRKFVADFGIQRFYDVGRQRHLSLQVIADNVLARPLENLVLQLDSHTKNTCAAVPYKANLRPRGWAAEI